MTELSFFQRYSQKENHITNNTLLMLRMAYRSNPTKLQTILERFLTNDDQEDFDLHIGPTFEQQIRGKNSVPDAVIIQQGFDLLIEVKPGENWNENQIYKHIETAGAYTSDKTILLLLSKANDPGFKSDLKKRATEKNVILVHGTFQTLIEILGSEDIVANHETELKEVVEDYRNLLWESDLLDDPYTMFAFGCSQTLSWNIENKMYYDHLTRPTKFEVLTGFYAKREIHAIGRIGAAVTGSLEIGFVIEDKLPHIDEGDVLNRVKAVIKNVNGDFSNIPLRWYVYDELIETSFKKNTPYGYFQGVWIHLKNAVGDKNIDPTNISELANAINGETFGNDRGYP